MSELKHTPGPWKVDEFSGDIVIDRECDYDGVIAYDEGILGWSYNSDECKANARLIAAAPEMLEALINEIKAFLPRDYKTGDNIDYYYLRRIEIIEKATGMKIEEIIK